MVKFDLAINLPATFDLESNAEQESILLGYVPTIAVVFVGGGGVGYTLPPPGYLTLDTLLHYTLDTPPPGYPTPNTPKIPYCLDALPLDTLPS